MLVGVCICAVAPPPQQPRQVVHVSAPWSGGLFTGCSVLLPRQYGLLQLLYD